MALKSLIRHLAALSLACITTTAVVAQETRSYPFIEVERHRKSSDIVYDGSLSDVTLVEAGRRLMCGSAWFTLERGFAYFSADPDRNEGSATLNFYDEPPRRSSVVSSNQPVSGEDLGNSVIDASWLGEVCDVELGLAQAEQLDPDELQAIRVRARQIPIMAAVTPDVSDEAPELVCVREPPLGSRIPKDFCATQAELDRLAEAAREWVYSEGAWGGIMEVNTID